MFNTILNPKNPHVWGVHLPAHFLGVAALVWSVANPSIMSLIAFIVFNLWLSGLGVSVGYHRYFTHRAFKTTRFWRWVMLIGGSLAGQGSIVFWAALHRLHHAESDQPLDVHSPVRSFWNAYMGWIFTLEPSVVSLGRATDLIRDPAIRYIHRNYNDLMHLYWLTLMLVALIVPDLRPFVAGALIAGMWSIHQEAIINSVCHDQRFGTQDHPTKDRSRNVAGLLSILTWGQSLHNNHHAFARSADFGEATQKYDPGYMLLIRSIRL